MKRPDDPETALDRLIAEGGAPLERLRAMIDEGDSSGEAEPFDIEEILQEARRRFATRSNAPARKPPSILANDET